jgi:scavenger receptor class B protein 1
MQAAASRGKNWNFFVRKAMGVGFKIYGKKIHVTKTAGEWLFEGFEDPMINLAKSNPFLSDIPTMFDKFGWFYKKNNTNFMLGDFNVDTGVNDIHNIGNILKWNHESSTSFFDSECARLTGSGGDFFNPNIKRNDTLKLFSPEMCRSIPMDFEEEVEIHGVKTLKFSGGDRAVDK